MYYLELVYFVLLVIEEARRFLFSQYLEPDGVVEIILHRQDNLAPLPRLILPNV